jgi:hypothetical protein
VALKRLIAYEGISLEFASVPGGIALSGLNLPVRNVGSDTIKIHIQSVTVGVNTETPLRLGPFPGTILPQTQLFPYHFKFEAGPLQDASKTVFVAFEVDYDTIPPTGQRRSYKKIAFPLSWPNGHNNAPQTEASIVDQWEQ